ncbi:MAG: type II toxin-antitoxin system HicA family toxin [Candidatus Kuenenia sp.]|nr:type II toxin-antitoxin system HicA family toxin [Candidatus Kuenenia sp.]
MSPKIPVITAKELIRALKRAGFSKDHQRGSHLTLINVTTNKTVTIPVHTGVDIGKGLLKRIVSDAGLTVEELKTLL